MLEIPTKIPKLNLDSEKEWQVLWTMQPIIN